VRGITKSNKGLHSRGVSRQDGMSVEEILLTAAAVISWRVNSRSPRNPRQWFH